jgi:hypothetical protein
MLQESGEATGEGGVTAYVVGEVRDAVLSLCCTKLRKGPGKWIPCSNVSFLAAAPLAHQQKETT